jgi:hypothetical protein
MSDSQFPLRRAQFAGTTGTGGKDAAITGTLEARRYVEAAIPGCQ